MTIYIETDDELIKLPDDVWFSSLTFYPAGFGVGEVNTKHWMPAYDNVSLWVKYENHMVEYPHTVITNCWRHYDHTTGECYYTSQLSIYTPIYHDFWPKRFHGMIK